MEMNSQFTDEAYAAGVEAGRKTERQECWDAINKWIKRGDIPGNGCDETAQRNGMILASNLIIERKASNVPSSPTGPASGEQKQKGSQ